MESCEYSLFSYYPLLGLHSLLEHLQTNALRCRDLPFLYCAESLLADAQVENNHFGQVVGASGAVLGFVGLTVADLAMNFEDLPSALLRLTITAAAIIFFIVTAVTKVRVESHLHQIRPAWLLHLCDEGHE